MHYSTLGDIVLLGDFNARTKLLNDFVVEHGSVEKEHCPTPNFYIYDQPNQRNNLDLGINEKGKLLTQLCIESGL